MLAPTPNLGNLPRRVSLSQETLQSLGFSFARETPKFDVPMSSALLAPLGVVCPACDFLNVAGAIQCAQCGQSTLDAGSDKPTKVAAGAQVRTAPAGASIPAARPVPTPAPIPTPAAAVQAPPRPAPQVASHVPPGMKPAARPSSSTPPHGAAIGPAAHVAHAQAPAHAQPAPPPAQATRPAAPAVRQTPTAPAAAPPSQAATAPAGPRYGVAVLSGAARGQRFKLPGNGAAVGRSKGAVLLPEDPFVSPLHATFVVRDGRLFVRDERSTSGVFVTIANAETLAPDSYFSAGLRLFHYRGPVAPPPPYAPGRTIVYGAPLSSNQPHYAVEEMLLGGRGGRALVSTGPVVSFGQVRCDFSYPNEEGLGPRHCELSPTPGGATLRDLSGTLGTFVRIPPGVERALKAGDRVRVGQSLLLIEAMA